jgi:hypothetical protein
MKGVVLPARRSSLPRDGLVAHALAAIAAFAIIVVHVTLMPTAGAQGEQGTPEVLADQPATAVDLQAQAARNSPDLAADPTDARVVALAYRLDVPDYSCALAMSGDGGRGWVPVEPVPVLPPGADKCYAPEVAFGDDGVLYYLFVGLQGEGNQAMGAFLTTSADRGQTFTEPRMVLGANRFGIRMAFDGQRGGQGRIHLAWLEATSPPPLAGLPSPPNPIMASYSDDGGATFTAPVQVSDPARQRVVAPAMTLAPDGTVHVLYYDLEDDAVDYQGLEGATWAGTWSLVLASSADGGATFGPSRVVDDQVVPPERVMLIFTMPPATLAADASGGVSVAWHDATEGDWDVWFRHSGDGGASWQGRVRLNDDPPSTGRHQYLPALSVAADGRIDAIFYDRRNDPENIRNEVFHTSSTDGGQTFAPNQLLSRMSFDSRIGPRYAVVSAQGLVEFGSRLALLPSDGETVMAWTDTRNTGGDPTGGNLRGQDVYTTAVVLGTDAGAVGSGDEGNADDDGGGLSLAVVVALVVAAAVAAVALVKRSSRARGPKQRTGPG